MRATFSRSLQSEINVTPLVDVCLVLLIIFMIVLPSMVNGIAVQLPETRTGDAIESRVFPVTVKDDGTVYLDTLVVRREEAPAALQRLRATESARPIAVRADKRVQYGAVVAVLAACREAGWTDVKLVSVSPEGASPSSALRAPSPRTRGEGPPPALPLAPRSGERVSRSAG